MLLNKIKKYLEAKEKEHTGIKNLRIKYNKRQNPIFRR